MILLRKPPRRAENKRVYPRKMCPTSDTTALSGLIDGARIDRALSVRPEINEYEPRCRMDLDPLL